MVCFSGFWLGVVVVLALLTVVPGLGVWLLFASELFKPAPPR
ncbi:hypothetical protein HSR121_2125 [Halapricum desulfuricans]|uniref:Uncharacterized protein n=1 Tax=Halapricum desulfuricans TaxID=2841257 RepID=A0A897N7T4_9EURY|nr:hypothetical protein HSR121_2125 [Halapricum desulfuricans]